MALSCFQHLVNFLHTDSLQIFARWVFLKLFVKHIFCLLICFPFWNREKRTHKQWRQILRTVFFSHPNERSLAREKCDEKCLTNHVKYLYWQFSNSFPRNRCRRSEESSHVFSVEILRTNAPSRLAKNRFYYQEDAAKRVQAIHTVSFDAEKGIWWKWSWTAWVGDSTCRFVELWVVQSFHVFPPRI